MAVISANSSVPIIDELVNNSTLYKILLGSETRLSGKPLFLFHDSKTGGVALPRKNHSQTRLIRTAIYVPIVLIK